MKLKNTQTRSTMLGAVLALGATFPLFALAQTGAILPQEPTHGSIQVGKNASESSLAKLATFGQAQAIEAATRHIPGKVTESELSVENQFLVWEVKSVADDGTSTELYIDAGNGEVLAMERDDEGKESNDNEDEGEEENERG